MFFLRKPMKYVFSAILCLAVTIFAAKYSADTRSNFLIGCLSGADRAACDCVLQKLESRYSEAEFKRVQNQVLAGKTDPKSADFLAKKRKECGIKDQPVAAAPAAAPAVQTATKPATQTAATPAAQPVNISASERMLLQLFLSNRDLRDSFMVECTKEASGYLGKVQSNKTCQCAFDRALQNDTLLYLLMGAANGNGEVKDLGEGGFRLISQCLPAQFNAEMEKAIVAECMKSVRGGNEKRCTCALNHIKKTYTVQSLLQQAYLNPKEFKIKLIGLVGKCVVP
jgi:hypothetical protein